VSHSTTGSQDRRATRAHGQRSIVSGGRAAAAAAVTAACDSPRYPLDSMTISRATMASSSSRRRREGRSRGVSRWLLLPTIVRMEEPAAEMIS
jgi:hypothetical protein